MALKSSDPKLRRQASLLKSMREEAGFTQVELANRINVSRETVSAIENCHVGTIDTIEQRVLSQWWSICRGKAHSTTRENFISLLKKTFKIS